jgi:carboxypeptidase Taq
MQTELQQLKDILAEYVDLRMITNVLEWDQQVCMPERGNEARSQHLALTYRLAHERITSAEVGRLLEALRPKITQMDPDSDEARLIEYAARQYDKLTRVPTEQVAAFAEATGRAHTVWVQARAENDFGKFKPQLEQIVDLRRQYAACFAPYDHIYDPLLDDYENGMKTADVQAIFDTLRPQQVELVRAIAGRPQVQDDFLYQPFDEEQQWAFGKEVITRVGYDWQRGRLDRAAHPFSIHFGIDDVRITTRVDPNFFNPFFFATLHETGHALYEMGVDPALAHTPLATGTSLAVHESQSRMWENLVGRSLPFWKHYYPKLQSLFSAQLGDVSLETFYKGINRVAPSYIRVEADEATYNLHIMLRLEIEIALMDGSLDVKDLPEYWNARMQDYLGIMPPDDTRGVLQDVHWSAGYIGYFATYALGNVLSAQLWECINQDIPDLTQQIEKAEFATLLEWVRTKIHRHGSKFPPQELVRRITGSQIDPAPYMRYLNQKYQAIYDL